MSDRYSTAGKRYSTDGLIGCLQAYRGFQRDCFSKEEIDAIIARLRAGDALYEAIILDYMVRVSPGVSHYDIMPKKLRKAIADYEEAT